MSLGGRDDLSPAISAYRTPTPAPGARNRYAEIMSQYGQAQPFSFFGYPQGYTGGFTPYQRIFDPKAAAAAAAAAAAQNNPVAMQDTKQRWNGEGDPPEGQGWQRTNLGQGQFEWTRTVSAPVPITGAGGSMGGADREAPSAFSQMTPAERAAYYTANPTEGKIALGLQDYVGTNPLAFISKVINPDKWYDSRLEKMGVDPTISLDTQNLLAGEAMQRALDSQIKSAVVTAPPVEAPVPAAETAQQKLDRENYESAQAWQRAQDQSNYEAAQAWQREQAASDARDAALAAARLGTDVGFSSAQFGGGSQRGGESVGGYTGVNTSRATSGQFGMGPGTPGFNARFAKGGYVSMQHLGGPDPEGPDDGYAALKDGEFVINDKAVKKYGIELMNLINSGKISKGKLRGLLEM